MILGLSFGTAMDDREDGSARFSVDIL